MVKLKKTVCTTESTIDITNELFGSIKEDMIAYDKQIEQKEEEINKYSKRIANLYYDLQEGIISEEEYVNYKEIYEGKRRLLDKQIVSIRKEMEKLIENEKKSKEWLRQMYYAGNLPKLNSLNLVSLVDRIYCGEDDQITIKLRYRNDFMKYQDMA